MTDTDLRARLTAHRALGSAPVSEHEWLIAHGTERNYAPGERLNTKGIRADFMVVVLTGHAVLRDDRGAGSHKIFEWRGGDVAGVLPFSRAVAPPGDVVAEEATETLQVPREHVPDLIRECPTITAIMVHAMLDRARQFTAADHRDEKLLSLGRLAAGLAHELNNPASAAMRSAKTLAESIDAAEAAARRLGEAKLSAAQIASIDTVRDLCRRPLPRRSQAQSAMARADREDEISTWLADHGANEDCAATLADTALTIDALDTLAEAVSGNALHTALNWITAGCSVRTLASDIQTSASRIYDLVGAVKGFTYMDHAPTAEPVDIRQGIDDTFTMLAAKIRAKSVDIAVDFALDLPRAHAVGAELNQVWMNLIDNAIDAVESGGHVEVAALEEIGRVVVRVVDDGPGIPPDIQGRIFDPFFTTKGVGKGTGLGLDIVRRLVQRQDGTIDVNSRPGRTEFRVSLLAAK